MSHWHACCQKKFRMISASVALFCSWKVRGSGRGGQTRSTSKGFCQVQHKNQSFCCCLQRMPQQCQKAKNNQGASRFDPMVLSWAWPRGPYPCLGKLWIARVLFLQCSLFRPLRLYPGARRQRAAAKATCKKRRALLIDT